MQAYAEGRRCEGSEAGEYVDVWVQDPQSRTEVVWERSEGNYTLLNVNRPPRIAYWYEDAQGCTMAAHVAGPRYLPCAAGGPPPPPSVGWGELLP